MIVIDANNLCYIAYHSTGELSWEDMKTGVIFGFLRNILSIAIALKSNKLVFCWDSKRSLRRKVLYSGYKSDRIAKYEDMTSAEREDRKMMNDQMTLLHKTILPELGFKNNFMATGFEADDLIAKIVEFQHLANRISRHELPPTIIVSTDKDLYQLLQRDNTSIYNPITKNIITRESFEDEYNIDPKEWVNLRALTGDKSDSIEGIESVGPKMAWRYLTNNECPVKIINRIADNEKIVDRNRKLIGLPFTYKGLPKRPSIAKDDFDRSSFIDVFDRYRFISFLKEENFVKWEKVFKI